MENLGKEISLNIDWGRCAKFHSIRNNLIKNIDDALPHNIWKINKGIALKIDLNIGTNIHSTIYQTLIDKRTIL